MGSTLQKVRTCCGRKGSVDQPESSTASDEVDYGDRGTWGNSIEFLLSTVGYAVGLGNLWRFPYLCFRNGGGAFLIPYVIFLFICGIPLVFLEMSLGQYAGEGPLSIWSICPLAKGLGMGMVMVSIYCCIYYNVIIMWTLYYLFHSFQKILPWARCDKPWNSAECTQLGVGLNTKAASGCNDTENQSNMTYSAVNNMTSAMNNMTSILCNEPDQLRDENNKLIRPPYPAEEFWDKKVLSRSDSIMDLVTLRWDLALMLLLAWAIVFLCLIKGIKSSGKVVYVTATLPYILLTILLIQGATMDGSMDGVRFYLKPDWAKLGSLSVWAEACGQIFFSLGAAWGGLYTMASYNKFDANIYRFSVVVPLINCGTSLYAGFVIFSVLGYMAKQAGVNIEDVVDSGPGLVFVAYPYALSQLPVPQLWSVVFFLMILSVGVDSQFGMFETFTTCIFDEWKDFFTTRTRKLLFTGSICTMSFLVGLFCCTHAGIYFFQLMDWYIGVFTLLFLSAIECLIISWIYGADRFYENIEMMIGYKPIALWKWMWKVVTPLFIVVMFFYSLATYAAPVYKKTVYYPAGAIGLAWLYGVSSSLPTPAYAVYLLVKTRNEGLSLWQRIVKYSQPSPEWGAKAHQQKSGDTDSTPEESMPLNEKTSDDSPPEYRESASDTKLTSSTEKLPPV